ncbi:MAG: SpoIID/LytB domain-containing protein [Lachnospiraceae bacterium]|nr:SpoIID/LytB domain-containing protein [Lachnospiraceae bacterium]
MKEKIKTCLALCILVVTVPYVVTLAFQGGEVGEETEIIQKALKEQADAQEKSDGRKETETQEESAEQKETETQEGSAEQKETETQEESAERKEADAQEESAEQKESSAQIDPDEKEDSNFQKTDTGLDAESYLTGILAKQIPLDYQDEAIKAQAVIARTSLALALETEGQKLPDSMAREEMLKLWGQEGFEKNFQRLEEAAKATKGEILLYDGKPIQPAFHAVSAGKTRSAKEALQREDEPYLAGADSEMDIPSPDFLKVVFLEQKEFADKIKELCPEISEENILESVTVPKRDSADYAVQVNIGEKTVTGEEFRNCLNLNSACFYLKEVEGKVRIVTKGLGHGLGLSQYGANELAKEGKTYREILQYYYKDSSIEKR